MALNSGAEFKNGRLLSMLLKLPQAKDANPTEYLEIQKSIVDGLRVNFERGGFDGWKKSVMEALMYKRLFQLYGLSDSLTLLEENIFVAYMTPVD